MRDYQEFATRLRREIDIADLGAREPLFGRLDERPRSAAGALRWIAVAAALLVAAGIGGYAGFDAYDGRRLVREHNRQCVDALFARGLLEIEALAVPRLDSLFESSDPSGPSSGSDWFAAGGTAPTRAAE